MALADEGLVSVREPFAGLFTQGMVTHETYRRQNGEWVEPGAVEITSEGMTRRARVALTGEPVVIGDVEKMSKSKRNVVAPGDIAASHGVDAARLFVLSDSPPERDVQWTTAGVEGAARLMNRIWGEFDALGEDEGAGSPAGDLALSRVAHRAIKAVTEAIEGFRFNSAVARLHEFSAAVRAARIEDSASPDVRREALSTLARLIAPFAPHLAEACWERLGKSGLLVDAPWPEWDAIFTEDEVNVLPVQINGKRRAEIRAPAGASADEVERLVLENSEVRSRLEGLTVRKVIVVPGRIVNLVAG
jgi:leucyl-tRNA synthetase